MESHHQNPEFRNNPENFHPCISEPPVLEHVQRKEHVFQALTLE